MNTPLTNSAETAVASPFARYRVTGAPPVRIAVSGASGLVGTRLLAVCGACGFEATRLSRGRTGTGCVAWDPSAARFDASALDGIDAVVHLAGENIASARWSTAAKRRIRDSRVQGTKVLCEGLARMARPPKTLVSASATGFYGDRGDETLTESSQPGEGFLAEVARDWEAATQPAVAAGIRVVNLRFGVILSPAGGALAQMLTPFRLGVGGRIGSGRQYWSWISLEDAVGAILHSLTTESVTGPVNAVAPDAVTNAAFTQILGQVLHRPTLFPMPAFAARLALGEMADALLLASTRVEPAKLLASGYPFLHPDLAGALRALLRK